MKGLPANERAAMLCCAAGSGAAPRGDVFVCRLAEAEGGWALGGEAAPALLSERSWLEAAQASRRGGGGARRDARRIPHVPGLRL